MKFFCWISIWFLLSCATTYELQTKPSGSKVYSGTKLLGATPLRFTSSEVSSREAGGILIRFEAEGHQNLFVWLPEDAGEHNFTFNLTPFFRRARVDAVVGELDMNRTDLYRLSDEILKLQFDLMAGRDIVPSALAKEINRLIEANPTLGSMYFLEALRLLREGKSDQGQKTLETALRFAPNEFDFLALLNEIKEAKKRDGAKK